MSIVDPASEWGAPVQRCDTCSIETDLGRIEGDGFLPDGDPCPDCDRGGFLTGRDDADYD